MNPAAKHFDVVLGVDIHFVVTPGGVYPIPHPFVGMVFDAIDWIPITIPIPRAIAEGMGAAFGAMDSAIKSVVGEGETGGNKLTKAVEDIPEEAPADQPPPPDFIDMPLNASVWVNGVPRGHAGTQGYGPIHIPIGGTFQRPAVSANKSKCELLLGSKTVIADGSPFTYNALSVLSCSCIGAPPPPPPEKGKDKSTGLFLPMSVVLPIPAGLPVNVGGPPTVNWLAMAFKLPGALKKLRATKLSKKIGEKLKKVAAKLFKNPSKINRVICTIFGEPVDGATGMVFTDNVDFELPGPITLKWERVWYSTSTTEGALGYGWHHSYEMALAFDEVEKVVALRMADGRSIGAPFLEIGEKFFDRQERLEFFKDEAGYGVLDCEERLVFRFSGQRLGKYFPVVKIENFTGQAIRFDYKPDGSLTRITDSAGRKLQVNTDWTGRIISILAPHPEKPGETFTIVSYEYGGNGDMVKCSDAMGYFFRYFYANHLMVQATFPSGINFYWKYDGTDHNARCIHTWGDGGIHNHKLEYHPDENYTIDENSLGHKTTIFYNDMGVVFRTLDPLGNVTSKKYNEYAEVLSETDELGLVTSYIYDEQGNKTGVFHPDGTSVLMQYKDNLLVAATDQNGGKWQWAYDEAGQLTERTDPLGNVSRYAYENGLITRITDPAGGVTKLEFDKHSNITALITPDGASSRWEYDGLGRCIASIDPKGNVQKRKFNFNGWVRQVNEPDGNVRELEYDPHGNVVKAKDKHHDVRFEYGGLDHLKARTEAGTRVEFKYDAEENLTGIINEHGYAYRFELDTRGEVVVESGFDGVTRRYVRDAAGQVVEVKRAGGITTKYEYDQMGRVTEVNHSDGSSEQYVYRADGELMEAVNEHIKVRFERDELGRVTKEMQGGFILESTFDVLGMRTGLSSSLGAELTFGRNIMGDVEKVSAMNGGTAWEASFKRDKLGLETERFLPGGVRSEWKRDRLGRPIEQNTFGGGGKLNRSRQYAWDVNDRLKQITDPQKGTWHFEHDALGNLAAAQYPDGAFEFRMPDAVGNLFRNKDQNDRKYGPAGQLLEADGTRYEYDPEGNLVQKTERDGATWYYEWNAAGMLRRVIRPDKDEVTFTYDALGRRISKEYRGKVTRWVWDGNVPLHEWVEVASPQSSVRSPQSGESDDPGSLIKIRRRNEQVTTAPANAPPVQSPITNHQSLITTWLFEPDSFAPLAKLNGSQQYSIVTDHLGTPAAMFNTGGEKVWEMDLSIYGEVRNLDGWREACPFRYPGQYEDVETGLYYNRFRYYDAEGGFYVSQDPIRLDGGMSFYNYVKDTYSYVDEFGLSANCHIQKIGKKRVLRIRDKFPPGSYASRQLRRFVKAWNEQILANGGKMTRRTESALEKKLSAAWKKMMRKKYPKRFKNKVVGHTPDAGWGGPSSGGKAMALGDDVNSYLGGLTKAVNPGTTYDAVEVFR